MLSIFCGCVAARKAFPMRDGSGGSGGSGESLSAGPLRGLSEFKRWLDSYDLKDAISRIAGTH